MKKLTKGGKEKLEKKIAIEGTEKGADKEADKKREKNSV